MRLVFFLILWFCLNSNALDKIDDKLIGTASLKVTIYLKHGVEFKDVYINKRSKLTKFATFPEQESILIQRSYGRLNIALSDIKRVSSRIGKPYIRTRNTNEIRLDTLLHSKKIGLTNNMDDEALSQLVELAPILTEVNIFGAKFTDKSISTFSKLKKLRTIMLWKPFTDKKYISKLKSKLRKVNVMVK